MSEFGMEFGKAMGQLIAEYRNGYTWLALVWHVSTLALLYLVFRYGNRYRKAFAAYFTINYVWLFAFVGVWMSVALYQRMGIIALATYGATPLMLLIILYQWYRELRNPRLDLDFKNIEKWRLFIAVPALLWGFWYPPYEWGVRLIFAPAELLFGAYGLMGCPTTMLALSLLFLKCPAGNRQLFYVMTMYGVFVGAAMVALLYVPDIPFFFLGVASLGLILSTRLKGRRSAARPGEAKLA
jgi:hypothetical protein